MNLTKEMKKAIVVGLLENAVAKHSGPIVAATVALNKLWKAEFVRNAVKTYPSIPKEQWKPLLQQGGGRSVSSKVQLRKLNPRTGYPENISVLEIGKMVINYDSKTEFSGWRAVKNAIDAKWTGLNYNISANNGEFKITTPLIFGDVLGVNKYAFINQGDYALGKLTDADQIDWVQRAEPLLRRSEEISERIIATARELHDYYLLLMDVLTPIRTMKRLQEDFPEATKFCPEQPAPKQEVSVPDKLAMARAILERGIPNE